MGNFKNRFEFKGFSNDLQRRSVASDGTVLSPDRFCNTFGHLGKAPGVRHEARSKEHADNTAIEASGGPATGPGKPTMIA